MKRFFVEASDARDVSNRVRDTQWEVYDRQRRDADGCPTFVSNHDSRIEARREARRLNQEVEEAARAEAAVSPLDRAIIVDVVAHADGAQ